MSDSLTSALAVTFDDCWGYSMARAWNPGELHWVAAGWENVGSTPLPYVVVFGRGRDHQAYLRWATS